MTTRPRTFLLDENIPKRVLSTLRSAGYAVTRVRDEQLGSQPDSAIFIHARARQMTIVTFDTDYLSQTKFPSPHAGILVLRFFPRNTSVETITSVILNAVIQLDSLDLSDHIYTVELDAINEVT